MKNAQKADTETLGVILGDLKRGKYVIPDFQREFEWNPWDVCDLVKSIFLDYYIGTLLLWKSKNRTLEALSCENIYGHKGDEKPDYIVLDGQQRLTAIYYAFIAPDINFPRRKNRVFYFLDLINYSSGNYDEAFEYEFYNNKIQQLIKDEVKSFKRHWFPLYLMGSENPRAVINWVDNYKSYWQEQINETDDEKQVKEFSQYIKNAEALDVDTLELATRYEISHIELDRDLEIEKVCDIFTQINSRGVKLNIFDLMNAMLKPHDVQLKRMWREVSPELEFLGSPKANVYLLQIMSILKQNYCSSKYLYYLIPGAGKKVRTDSGLKKITLIQSGPDFKAFWDKSVRAISDTLKTVSNPREFGVINPKFLPYPSIIPIFSAIRYYVKGDVSKNQIDIKNKIQKWYWASILTNRYSSAVESTSAKDFLELKAWINDHQAKPQAVRDYESSIGSLELKTETIAGTAIYRAMMNLMVINGARDFSTGELPEHEDLDDHHIVPKWWGKQNGLSQEINSICNRTLITENTNRYEIGTAMPSDYLRELIQNNSSSVNAGIDIAREILDSHFISEKAQVLLMKEDFTTEDYQEFIKERERSLIEGIKINLMKEIPSLQNTHLNMLNKDIEEIELKLRELICSMLEEDEGRLPQHILPKAKGRIQAMLKKDGAKKAEDYQDMLGLLSFFDLRELEAVIISKGCWPDFADVIGNKETFIKKMDQLAELRNPLRHSRIITEVAHKEGDAAVVWFKDILSI